MASSSVGNKPVACSGAELASFNPSSGLNCGAYLVEYIAYAGGTLLNPDATAGCQFCPVASTESILGAMDIYSDYRWRDCGITVVYSVVNILASLFAYWAFRMPRKRTRAVMG